MTKELLKIYFDDHQKQLEELQALSKGVQHAELACLVFAGYPEKCQAA